MDILLAAVILVITVKTFIVAIVVKGFGYSNKTSLLVSLPSLSEYVHSHLPLLIQSITSCLFYRLACLLHK